MSMVDMRDARRVALSRLIDDAALFPPARLPMALALAGHARHRGAGYRWMVGRFLCPASRLSELRAALPGGQRLALGVILDGVANADSGRVRDAVAADLAAAAPDPAIGVSGFEVRLPAGHPPGGTLTDILEAAGAGPLPGPLQPYLEVPVAGQPAGTVAAAIAAIAAARAPGGGEVLSAPAAKVRCGGPHPEDFPTPEELAAFLVACRDQQVPFKATAGLHHPLRHTGEDGITQHGFLNLLAAAALAREGRDPERLAAVLDERDAAALRLDATGLQVTGQRIATDALAAVRGDLLLAYGSCSIDEPVEDLVALGVLSRDTPTLI